MPMAAWDLDVTWGSETAADGEPITWRALCAPEHAGCGASR
jgi:hypothetical protein